MALADLARLKGFLDLGRQVEKAHGIGYRLAALAEAACDLALGQAKLVLKPRKGAGHFNRIQIFALEILDNSQFEPLAIVTQVAHDSRNAREVKHLRREKTTLARDEFILHLGPRRHFTLNLRNHDGLQETELANRSGQLLNLFFVKNAARLVRVGVDLLGFDLEDRLRHLPAFTLRLVLRNFSEGGSFSGGGFTLRGFNERWLTLALFAMPMRRRRYPIIFGNRDRRGYWRHVCRLRLRGFVLRDLRSLVNDHRWLNYYRPDGLWRRWGQLKLFGLGRKF